MAEVRFRRLLQLLGVALLSSLAACGSDELGQPVDGGLPLTNMSSEHEAHLTADPCWRREGGGWHYSTGHCSEMLPAQRITGVWVIGFEERSFFPGNTALPDRNDPRRYRVELEVDADRVGEMAGRGSADDRRTTDPGYQAYALTFVGRRTRYPLNIDCYGGRSYVFIADRIESSRHLGPIADADRPQLPRADEPRRPFQRSGEGGVIAQMEEAALARCFHRREPGS